MGENVESKVLNKTSKLKKIHSVEELVDIFKDLQLNDEQKFNFKLMKMPLNWAKMILFLSETQLNNNEIDAVSCLPNHRLESETFDLYKVRQKLQKSLMKYRKYIYKYSAKHIISSHE